MKYSSSEKMWTITVEKYKEPKKSFPFSRFSKVNDNFHGMDLSVCLSVCVRVCLIVSACMSPQKKPGP